MEDEIKKGYALIDNRFSLIRKITDRGVVCWLMFGRGNSCEKMEDFKKHKIIYLTPEQVVPHLKRVQSIRDNTLGLLKPRSK